MCDIYSWVVAAVAWGCSFYIDQKGNVLLRTDRWKSGTQMYFCVFLYLRFVFASISIYLLCKKWRKTGTQTFSYFVFAHICCISIFAFILIRTKTHRPAGKWNTKSCVFLYLPQYQYVLHTIDMYTKNLRIICI